MARPRLKIDEALVEKLASIHCTMEEIASVCGCSVDTLERRFAELIKKAKDKGKSSLRRHQWEAAQKGNTTMLIWLGKQLLDQRDKTESHNHSSHLIQKEQELQSLPDAELERRIVLGAEKIREKK